MEATLKTTNALEFTKNWPDSPFAFSSKSVEEAKAFLAENDFPTTRQEAWKYTRLAKLSKQRFQLNNDPQDSTFEAITQSSNRLVFVNGVFHSSLSNLSKVDGLTLGSLSQDSSTLADHDFDGNEFFTALNIRYAQDGLRLIVAKNKTIDEPIEVVFVQTGENAACIANNFITLEEGAKASVILNFQSNSAINSFCNVITSVNVHQNAHLTLYKTQTENASSTSICTENVHQHRDSYFHIHTTTLDGQLVRNNLNIAVKGQNADTHLNGMYLGHGEMHVDNHTVVDHQVANCESNELYKGVLSDRSTGVFNGKVFVRKDAQKINAFQSNGNVLLSDEASVNSKPELEIYADDVKCSHGSTTGQLDEEAVFYLRARGISEKAARQLMISAFIGDVLEKIELEEVKGFLEQKLNTFFGWEF